MPNPPPASIATDPSDGMVSSISASSPLLLTAPPDHPVTIAWNPPHASIRKPCRGIVYSIWVGMKETVEGDVHWIGKLRMRTNTSEGHYQWEGYSSRRALQVHHTGYFGLTVQTRYMFALWKMHSPKAFWHNSQHRNRRRSSHHWSKWLERWSRRQRGNGGWS